MSSNAVRTLSSSVEDPSAPAAAGDDDTLQSVRNPTRVAEVVNALVRNNEYGVMSHRTANTRIRPLSCDTAAGTISWEVTDTIASVPMQIELNGYTSVYRLKIEEAVQRGSRLTTRMPTSVEHVSQRWERRQTVTDLEATLAGADPSSTSVAVNDVSYGGLSVRLPEAGALAPGDHLADVTVRNPAGGSVRLDCEVQHVREVDGGGVVCGLKIKAHLDRSTGWLQIVNDRMFPGTQTGSQWAEEVWELYGKCGYLGLSGKEPAQFSRLKRAFKSVSRQLDRAPQLACQIAWPNPDGTLSASLSMIKLYETTWFPFQLGKVTGPTTDGIPGRKVLRDIHLRAYEHIKLDPNLKWILAYTQVKDHWSRMAHHDLPAEYIESGDACVVRFRALATECAESPVKAPIADGVEVGLATADDELLLATTLAATRPLPYCEALDLVEGRMGMHQIKRMWQGVRMERDRGVIIMRTDGAPTAAAVVESAADGIHLYGLLDVVRLYPLADGGEHAYSTLIEAARTWFRARGKDRCVVCLEGRVRLPDATMALMEDMGEADIVVLSAKRIPHWLERLYEITAPQSERELEAPGR